MDIDAETALVAMAMYEPHHLEQVRDELPDTEYINNPTNRTVLEAVYDLDDRGAEVSPVTVAEELEGEVLRKIGGTSALAEMANSYTSFDRGSLESIIDRVIEAEVERRTREEVLRAKDNLESEKNVKSIINELSSSLEELQSETVTSEIKHLSDCIPQFSEMLEHAQENQKLPGNISTGFPGLDDRMKGISPNDFVLLSADTGLGKTSLALQIADNVAGGQDKNVLIFSGEMHGWEVLMKLLSKRGVATLDEMQDGELSEDQMDRITYESQQLNDQGIYTIMKGQPTVYDFRSAVRKADSEYGIDLAVLDYVQMLRNPRPEKMDDVEYLNLVSNEIRDFTNEGDIPVLCISRENKAGEVYGSSQFKFDCNYRIVIEDPNPDVDEDYKRMISVEKARLAKGGSIAFTFEGENSRFVPVNDRMKHQVEPQSNGKPF